jgi:hypothetical protein
VTCEPCACAHPRTNTGEVFTYVHLDILQLGTTDVPRTTIELLRVRVATALLFLFFSRGRDGIECLTGDLVTAQRGNSLRTVGAVGAERANEE